MLRAVQIFLLAWVLHTTMAHAASTDLQARLSIEAKTSTGETYRAQAGERLVLVLTIRNLGTRAATNVAITAIVPRGLIYSDHRVSHGDAGTYATGGDYAPSPKRDIADQARGSFNFGGGLWRVGNIGAGEQRTLIIEVQVARAAAGTTLNFQTGYTHASTSDTTPDNNRDAIKIAVEARKLSQDYYARFVAGTRIAREVHVDNTNPQARDTNPGTVQAPFATIKAAVASALHARKSSKASTRIFVHNGVYRESIEQYFKDDAQPNGPKIVIQAIENGQAVISGSELWRDGWTKHGSRPGVYAHQWPFGWGPVAQPWPQHDKAHMDPLGLRREMIFVDGIQLLQQLNPRAVPRTKASFYVDNARKRVIVNLPDDLNLEDSEIEVAARATLIQLDRLNNLALIGLVFEHSNAPYTKGAVRVISQTNVLIQNCIFQWNNARGLAPWHVHQLNVVHSIFNNNGEDGISGGELFDSRWEASETSYNNWRGFLGGLIGWAPGNKTYISRNLHIYDHVAVGNLSRGLWLDKDNRNTLIDNALICDNLFDGLFIEANPGPITVRNSLICNNGRKLGEAMQNIPASGLRISSTTNLTLRNNTFRGNMNAQINLSGHNQNRSVGLRTFKPATHDKTVRDVVINNRFFRLLENTLISTEPEQSVYAYVKGRGLWNILFNSGADSFIASENTYCHPSGIDAKAFEVRHGAFVDYAEWRTSTGDSSTFAPPDSNLCTAGSGG